MEERTYALSELIQKKKLPNMNGHAFHLPVVSFTTGFPEKSTDPSPVYISWFVS